MKQLLLCLCLTFCGVLYTSCSKSDVDEERSEVMVTPAALTLHTGESEQLSASIVPLPRQGSEEKVQWTTDDRKIATISENGKVTAVAPGKTKITAHHGVHVGYCDVTVEPSIYIGGTKAARLPDNTYTYQAVLWKNGVEKALTGLDKKAHVYRVMVNKGDVYAVGALRDLDGEYFHAALWKNGELTELTMDEGIRSYAYDIAIKDNDVYIAGAATLAKDSNTSAVLWKNGVQSALNTGTSFATSLCIDKEDIYISGSVIGEQEHAAYWKNGKEVILEKEMGVSSASRIKVHDGHIYVVGYRAPTGFDMIGASLWIDGQLTRLGDGVSQNSEALDIAFDSKGRTHVVGAEWLEKKDDVYRNACLWIEGEKTLLPGTTAKSLPRPEGICIVGDNVYIVGDDEEFLETPPFDLIMAGSVLWTNGILDMFTEKVAYSHAYSIVVE